MRPIHIVGFAQLDHALRDTARDEAEMVQQVTAAALEDAGLGRKDVGFTCSGSNDYVMGRAFSFTMAIDGLAAWPPIRESHVEMDGAWALYEAWVRLQHGDVDIALAYSFGKSSLGGVAESLTYSLDPYFLAPLEPGPDVLAALQARRMLDVGLATEADFAAAVERARQAAGRNPQVPDPQPPPTTAAHPPLGPADGPVRTDGAAAIVLKVGGGGPRISGIAHRIDAHQPGARDLATCPSAVLAAQAAGIDFSRLDVAEFHAPYSSQVVLLSKVLGLSQRTQVNPSGGALAADTPMVAGLVRIGEAARAVRSGARHALGHASSGACLQHNLVCALEAE